MNQNAREVLIANSKAMLEGEDNGIYAAVRADGVLCWYGKDGNERCPVALHVAFRQDWVPYHEVKEIRPEKAGELWQRDDEINHRCVTYEGIVGLNVIWWGGVANTDRVDAGMVHNKNGWARIYPPVEEVWGESVIQDDKYKAAQIYANQTAQEAIKLLADLERQKQEYEKMILSQADKPFVMDEMSARVAGKWPLKIEIDRVEWDTDGEVVYPRAGFDDWKSLVGKPPMRMILLPLKE